MRPFLSQLPGTVLAVLLIAYLLRPVSRARLERFARRQSLEITVAGGALIIGYLATTRRWRVGGFVVGLLISFGANYTQRSSNAGGAGALVGWFVGALVAEWRAEARHAATPRRSALLLVRRLTDYVPRWFLIGNATVWLTAIALGVRELVPLPSPAYAVIIELGAVVVVTPLTWLIARRVVTRPQAVMAEEMLAADDALRSRSLHVLAGCALAVNGILAALMATAAYGSRDGWSTAPWTEVLLLMATVAIPVIAFLGATEPFAARRLPVAGAGVRA